MVVRALLAVLLLLAGLATARADATFDTYLESLSPTNYWPETTNGNDVVGSQNPTCTGTCTFGQTLATHVSGFTVSSTGYLGFSSIALTNISGWKIGFWINPGTSTNQQAFVYLTVPGSNQGVAFMASTSPVCTTGYVDFRLVVNGTNTDACSTSAVNDGAGHYVFEQCYSGNCNFFLDGNLQASAAYSFSSYAATGYTLGNYAPSQLYPITGPMGGVAYWAAGTPFSQGQIQAIYTCGTTGVCSKITSGCPSPPSPLWCDTFETYSGGNNSTLTAPKLLWPYQDAQALASGTINNGTACTSGSFLTLTGAHLGDEVIGTPGFITSCGTIPFGQGYDFQQIIAAGGGPNGTLSATVNYGGMSNVNLTAFKSDAQGTCSISGTTMTVSSTAVGAFAPGQIVYDSDNSITVATYIVSSLGGGQFTVNVSQTATPTSPCIGSLWGMAINAANIRVFNTASYAGAQSAGVGTTGTAANMARMFTANVAEGYLSAPVFFIVGNNTNWDAIGPGVGFVNSAGQYISGLQLDVYSLSGPANSMDVKYGTALACTMTGSPFTFVPGVWHQMVLAWRSAADATGYVKMYWDGVLVASALGANQGSPCFLPATINAAFLLSEGSSAGPAAEYFVDNVGVYNAVYGAVGGAPVLIQGD